MTWRLQPICQKAGDGPPEWCPWRERALALPSAGPVFKTSFFRSHTLQSWATRAVVWTKEENGDRVCGTSRDLRNGGYCFQNCTPQPSQGNGWVWLAAQTTGPGGSQPQCLPSPSMQECSQYRPLLRSTVYKPSRPIPHATNKQHGLLGQVGKGTSSMTSGHGTLLIHHAGH